MYGPALGLSGLLEGVAPALRIGAVGHSVSGDEMTKVLITGMSGTGKSSAIRELARRGYMAIDTDWDPAWEEPPPEPSDGAGWIWREDRIAALLAGIGQGPLFVSACVENQGKFYPEFDHIVLLSLSREETVKRLATRTTNVYGKQREELAEVLSLKETVEPLLRSSATLEIDAAAPFTDVVERLIALVR